MATLNPNTIIKPPVRSRLFVMFIVLIFKTALLSATLCGQNDVSTSFVSNPGSLVFTTEGQIHLLHIIDNYTFHLSGGIPRAYYVSPNHYFKTWKGDRGRELHVQYTGPEYTINTGSSSDVVNNQYVYLILKDSLSHSELLRIPILLHDNPDVQVHAGLISSDISIVHFGSSAGILHSDLPAMGGGSGSYTYQWQYSDVDPYDNSEEDLSSSLISRWHDIPGATDLSYSPGVLTRSRFFRRLVKHAHQTISSNILPFYVVNPTTPNHPVEPFHPIAGVPSKPDTSNNYLLTRTMLSADGTSYYDQIDYYDGLGRSDQSVLHRHTPDSHDLVLRKQGYDGHGRPTLTWHPVPTNSSNGSYFSQADLQQLSQRYYHDPAAYTKTIYEPSPLNRIRELYGPGSDWHIAGRSDKTEQLTNSAAPYMNCLMYCVASPTSIQLKGSYLPGTLYVDHHTDESNHHHYTFADNLGRLILSREILNNQPQDTYYVYDDLGNLSYILPPSASRQLTTPGQWADNHNILYSFAFIYKYDRYRRCTARQIPGGAILRMYYDRSDRLIFSQDGNQKRAGLWRFYLYDIFGRETVSGLCKYSTSIPNLEEIIVCTNYTSNTTPLAGYTVNLPIPKNTIRLLTVNYYDDYLFLQQLSPQHQHSLSYKIVSGYEHLCPSSRGRHTGTILFSATDANANSISQSILISAMYYDHKGRVIQRHSSNHLGGYDDNYIAYTFTGKPHQQLITHNILNNPPQQSTYLYHYDHAERLTHITHQQNSSPEVTLVKYLYDPVGRVQIKRYHNMSDSLRYAYNIRNWTTGIHSGKFSQTLSYNSATDGLLPKNPRYDGSVSAMRWRSGNETANRNYQFVYDDLNRLTNAIYDERQNNTSETNPIPTVNRFNESLSYDAMGNITRLIRRGRRDAGYGVVDDLSYSYKGTRLIKVKDAVVGDSPADDGDSQFRDLSDVAEEYLYDDNGNIIKDLNKNIVSISYTVLNQPYKITFADGKNIRYTYDGSGARRSVLYTQSSATGSVITSRIDYIDDNVYHDGVLEMLHTPEGYITMSGGNPIYHYYLRDHQDNNRVVITETGVVEQVNHYYPFGALFGEGIQSDTQPYRYNGKELDSSFKLYLYDYGARQYDPIIARWTTLDPMAEKYPTHSPYIYCVNNPVRFIDPDGRDPIYAKNFWGKVKLIGDDGKQSTGSYLVRGSVARAVKAATKAGEFYLGDLSENKRVMHIPTGQKLEGVKQSYEDTKISQKENGGHSNIGDANVTRWDEGPAAITFTDKDGNQGTKASLQMFVIDGKNTMPTDASNVEMWWHTHPNITVNGISLGNSNPSDADYSGQKTMTNKGYKGNTFVIGVRSGTVTFFNKDGALTTVKWSDFLRMGGQKE